MIHTRTVVAATPSCGGLSPVASASSRPVRRNHPASTGNAWKRSTAALFLMAAILAAPVSALTLSWDPNPESDITSYQLCYGTTPGSHPTQLAPAATTTATITGLVEGTTYYFVVTAINQAGLESTPSAEISYQVPVTTTTPTVLTRTGWSVLYVDSQETNGYSAAQAIDGATTKFWHTGFTGGTTPAPHEIQIDMGGVYSVAGFHYLPRQDKYLIGNIGQYEFYVSMDGMQWGTPVATGTFANNKTEKEVLFTASNARYVRLRCLAEANGGDDCAVAELNVLGSAATVVSPTLCFTSWASTCGLTGQNASLLACPQKDGVPNLLKYAFNLDVKCPDTRVLVPGTGTAGLPLIRQVMSGSTAKLRFEYIRLTDSQLTYTALKSVDLKTWSPLTSTPTITTVSTGCERVVVEEPCDSGKPMIFGRVQVVSTAP